MSWDFEDISGLYAFLIKAALRSTKTRLTELKANFGQEYGSTLALMRPSGSSVKSLSYAIWRGSFKRWLRKLHGIKSKSMAVSLEEKELLMLAIAQGELEEKPILVSPEETIPIARISRFKRRGREEEK